MKLLAAVWISCVTLLAPTSGVDSASAPPDAPLIPIPPGCDGPPPATVIFEGTLLARDARTGRFRIEQVRAGSDAGYAVSGLVDVRLGPDVRFLATNESYLIGAAPLGPNLPLGSTVRAPQPTFGGNAVIELDEASLECPTLEAPLQVLNLDGSPIDTGLTTGLGAAKNQIVRAIMLPAVVAFLIVIALVLVRWFFTGMFRVGTNAAAGQRRRPSRERSHGLAEE